MDSKFVYLPVESIRPDPNNARQILDKEGIEELAQQITEVGLLYPILVQESKEKPGEYILMDGFRRLKAHLLAEIPTIKAEIRGATDKDDAVRLIANLGREQLHPWDEATALGRLQISHKIEIPEIALRIGKSEKYVRERLQLLSLVPKAQVMLQKDQIGLRQAFVLARERDEIQNECLKNCKDEAGLESVSELKDYIERHFKLVLAEAPFDVKDAELVPKAGACETCPKRTGANPGLFTEYSKDLCSDPKCYNIKLLAGLNKKKKEVEEKHKKAVFITESHYHINSGVEKLQPLMASKYRLASEVIAEETVKGIMVDGDHVGKVVEIALPGKYKERRTPREDNASAAEKAARKRKIKQNKIENEKRRRVFKAITEKVMHPTAEVIEELMNSAAKDLFYNLPGHIFKAMGWEDKTEKHPNVNKMGHTYSDNGTKLKKKLAELKPEQRLSWLFVLDAVDDLAYIDRSAERLMRRAKIAGVNTAQIEKEVREMFDKKKTKPAVKKEKKPAKAKAGKKK